MSLDMARAEKTSEYRSLTTEPAYQLEEDNTAPQPTMNRTYSSVASNETVPKKDQAITMESIINIPTKEYAMEIAKITGPSAIRYISRISQNRICVFLATKQLADELINTHKRIKINNTIIEIKPLVAQSQRIILSNVFPTIPNNTIEETLKSMKIKPTSKITYLRAGITELPHTLSFRRQIYIDPQDTKKVPDSFIVTHDNSTYRIFASTDTISCFLCKQEGHIARTCPDQNINNNNSEPLKIQTNEECPDNNKTMKDKTDTIMEIDNEPIQGTKRHHAATTISETDDIRQPLHTQNEGETINQTDEKEITTRTDHLKPPNTIKPPKKKKAKKEEDTEQTQQESVAELLEPARELINKPENNFILTYEQLKSFLENAYGSKNPLEIATEYTKNTQGLISMIKTVYPYLKGRSIKNRCSRITKKLQTKIELQAQEDESDQLSSRTESDWE